MRALFWIVGAFVSAAGGALILNRRAKKRVMDSFLDALKSERIEVKAYQPSIPAAGFRAEAFKGVVGGKPFVFAAKTDVSGTRWSYALIWSGSRLFASWNPLSGGEEHPLQLAYLILRRRTSKDDGALN